MFSGLFHIGQVYLFIGCMKFRSDSALLGLEGSCFSLLCFWVFVAVSSSLSGRVGVVVIYASMPGPL